MCRRRLGCLLLGLLLSLVVGAGLAAVAYRALASSPACRRPDTGPASPGLSGRTLTSGGRERCYLLYVPDGYDPARPAPVVVSLHGFISPAAYQRGLDHWDEIADREGFLVVYPEGTGFPLRWNAFPSASRSDVDDVQLIRDVLDDVARIAAVDPARIYANGMSNGGSMTHRLACDVADRIAAAGVVAGPQIDGPCSPSRPVPIVAFYGSADRLVPYEGGDTRAGPSGRGREPWMNMPFQPAEVWAAGWAARNGCSPAPEPISAAGDVSGLRYGGCQDGADVLFYRIEGGGHTWPGGGPTYVGKTSTDISASEAMWQFFAAHPLE